MTERKTINSEPIAFDFFTTYPQLLFLSESDQELLRVFNLVYDEKWNEHWIDSSSKNDNPPDFYSDEYKLMMEFMIVDDHAHEDSLGLINPQKKNDAKAYNELKDYMTSALFDQIKFAIINTLTDLPSEKDHNYTFYIKEFKRVISKHIEKIPLYRRNHPKYKLIFFIQDESSAYFDIESKYHHDYNNRQPTPASPHLPFLDEEMIRIFKGADIDYIIWWMPYRMQFNLPTVAILKPESKNFTKKYDPSLILSSEE